MFEIERNFSLSKEQSDRLLDGASFEGLEMFSDIYFDTADFELTKTDLWLRRRDGRFELKIPIEGLPDSGYVDEYQELESDAEIRVELELPGEGAILDLIRERGYHPFCICTTTRQVYKKDGFTIVVDEVVYAGTPLSFTTCEIELLVERQQDVTVAADRVNAFAESCGLSADPSHGKVIEYLHHERPDHYRALAEAGRLTRSTGSG
jgi:adenylate cyclase class IV